jgi:putative RNA 2'-phosphotransferase
MEEKRKTSTSKFLSLILRHQPEQYGLKLEPNGWTQVDDVIKSCSAHGHPLTLEELREIVDTNEKKRFSFDESGLRIRANQGHSTTVDIEFQIQEPPAILFHGTAERNVAAILAEGLKKMSRHHVHLSADTETARKVGIRYDKPVIFEIDATAMRNDGHEFRVSENGVWLVESVPPAFLKLRLGQ